MLAGCSSSSAGAVLVLVELAIAKVEIGMFCGFSSYFKYGYFQKPEGFRLQQRRFK